MRYIGNGDVGFAEYKEEIKGLFKEAGIKDSTVIHQEFLGFGRFANMHVSVHDNIMNTRQDIVALVNQRFFETKGVFRKRYKESFSPIFWIEFILKLPQYLMAFFGVLPEKIIVKILLLIYWIVVAILGLKQFDLLPLLAK